jgi:hypothetical protein
VFADGFVLSEKWKDACRDAAERFVSFINRPEIQEMLLLGLDSAKPGEPPIPRYLLAATKNVYERPLLREDPFYPRFRSSLDSATAFPNQGFKDQRKRIRKEVEKVLQQ